MEQSARRSKLHVASQMIEALARIAELNPRLNAFITVIADQPAQPGPLQGLPIGIKDFYDTAGIRTTAATVLELARRFQR